MVISRIPLESVPCPLCGGREEKPLFELPDRLGRVPGRFRIVRCGNCSLLYLNPRPLAEALPFLYPGDYFTHRASGNRESKVRLRHFLRPRVLPLYYGWPRPDGPPGPFARLAGLPLLLLYRLDRRSSLTIPFQGQGRFLDAGCGAGRWLELMCRGGWHGAGMEPDLHAAQAAATRGLPVVQADLEASPFLPERFDVVLLSHVLEHLPHPLQALSEVHRMLAPGGRVYVRVPNGEGWCARRFGGDWYGLDVPRHLCTFTRRTARALLEKAGFQVESVHKDRNFLGWKKSLLHCGRPLPAGWGLFLRVKPLVLLVEYMILGLDDGDVLLVTARKG